MKKIKLLILLCLPMIGFGQGTWNCDPSLGCIDPGDGSGNITSTFNIPINPNRKLEKVVDILVRKQKKKQINLSFTSTIMEQ